MVFIQNHLRDSCQRDGCHTNTSVYAVCKLGGFPSWPQVALIFVCATTDDGYLIKLLSVKLLHHKVTLYPFFCNFYNSLAG